MFLLTEHVKADQTVLDKEKETEERQEARRKQKEDDQQATKPKRTRKRSEWNTFYSMNTKGIALEHRDSSASIVAKFAEIKADPMQWARLQAEHARRELEARPDHEVGGVGDLVDSVGDDTLSQPEPDSGELEEA